MLLGGLDKVVLAGLDGVTLTGLDESKLRTCANGGLAEAGGTTEPGLMTPNLDDPCFDFLWLHRLGRLPKSKILNKVFLLSPVTG